MDGRRSRDSANVVQGGAVPAGTHRLILSASIEQSDSSQAFHLWLEHQVAAAGIVVGVAGPFVVASGTSGVKIALPRPILLAAGDELRGRCSPAVVTAESLTLNMRFIDLPITGEFVPGL